MPTPRKRPSPAPKAKPAAAPPTPAAPKPPAAVPTPPACTRCGKPLPEPAPGATFVGCPACGEPNAVPRGGQHGPSPVDGDGRPTVTPEQMAAVRQPEPQKAVTPAGAALAARLNGTAPPPARSGEPPHVVVLARAGTGKTTTLAGGIQAMLGITPTDARGNPMTPSPQQAAVWDALKASAPRGHEKWYSICFVAFNRSIRDELARRLPKDPRVSAKTMHQLGAAAVYREFKAAMKDQSDRDDPDRRSNEIVAELLGTDLREVRKTMPLVLRSAKDLAGLCKMNLVGLGWGVDDPRWADALEELAERHDVELVGNAVKGAAPVLDESGDLVQPSSVRDVVFPLVPRMLERAKDVAKDGYIDFNDMIWLPIALNLRVWQNDVLLVDECLPGWTPVMMGDGSSKPIKDVVAGDVVRSYDTVRGRACNRRVTATQKIPNRKPLVTVKVRQNHKTPYTNKTTGRHGGSNYRQNRVTCTTDHKVWTTNRGWVDAGLLVPGDGVIVETAAVTTQRGKISKSGRDRLSSIHVGNTKGTGVNGKQTAAEFNRIKGGNGRPLPAPQQLLLDALGEEWRAEYVVSTGPRRDGYPTHYKIDLAHPDLKIALELDGPSHRGAEAADAKKDEFLRGLGWTVFRVTNREVTRDFAAVLEMVCPGGGHCPVSATVTSVEPTYINEHYVYDISVEGTHCFYGNGVLVHNCQDLNRCQQALARRAGKRLVLCGDDRQAVYGFAGADSDSLPRMTRELGETARGCVTLPLNVTRRCGRRIVDEARAYVQDFHAHESNPEGEVRTANYPVRREKQADGSFVWKELPYEQTYLPLVQDGDMVLCRANAPLVRECLRFIKKGRKATIQGRKIGDQLVALVERLGAETIPQLVEKLTDWLKAETDKEMAERNPSENKLQALNDRYECVRTFVDVAHSVEDVKARINAIFTDNDAPGVKLSSIHRAKGLEADSVFVIEGFGPPMEKLQPWERVQETNCRYIAATRARETLTYVV